MKVARLQFTVLVAATILCTNAAEAAKDKSTPIPSMAGVKWNGAGTTIESLRGKAVFVLSYVTWCPICNEWSPRFLKQLKDTADGKPVVVIALSTSAPTVSGPEYMGKRNFIAPNILHGHDPSINKKLKLGDDDLFSYALFDSEGKFVSKGEVSYYGKDGSEDFVPARELAKVASSGKFEMITASMSDSLKELLWPIELGYGANDTTVAKIRRSLGPSDAKLLDSALNAYLDARLESLRETSSGNVPAKLNAFDQATALSTNFKSTAQGREARQILVELNKDTSLKREVSAKIAYDKMNETMSSRPEQRAGLLKGFLRTYDGTFYAELAKEESP